MSTPAIDLKSSIDMCALLPLPPDAYESLPGLRLRVRDELRRRCSPAPPGLIDHHVGRTATWLTGAKSRWMSYGSFAYTAALMPCDPALPMISV